MTAAAAACPACGGSVADGQEYCLHCGLRQPGRWRVGPPPTEKRGLRLRVGALAAVAVAGAAVAVAVASDGSGPETVRTALGGSATVPVSPAARSSRLAQWGRSERGWTIVLISVPKTRGRGKAVAVAQQARSRGLQRVGVLDSSAFASLSPGYWMTFSGKYDTEAEATSVLRKARAAVKAARVAQISS
ncbi:hypothetical protein [Gaiella sp.]|uniref:hypothetical protein n=1 Tax=Gaiella sp. TaxID=2663207 RepID=UPI002E33671C|nr:hypothetical protein [Gaiella sp.]HEX5583755.1 hypothetical protein [Gaiella sp.]